MANGDVSLVQWFIYPKTAGNTWLVFVCSTMETAIQILEKISLFDVVNDSASREKS